jgi:hypothetical protein
MAFDHDILEFPCGTKVRGEDGIREYMEKAAQLRHHGKNLGCPVHGDACS